MSTWKTCKLGDVCVKIGSGATPLGGANGYIKEGVSFIRCQNVYNLYFEQNGLAHISERVAHKLQTVAVEEGDVLLNITGDSVARACLTPKVILPARVSQHVMIVRSNRKDLTPHYLVYQLTSPAMQKRMLGIAVGRGASRSALTKEMVANLPLSLPPLAEQERIAGVLGAYDDLIAVNERRMALLEEAAHRLWRDRFVTHADPAWPSRPIKDCCATIQSGGTPSRGDETLWTGGTIDWFKTKELQDSWLLSSEEKITERAVQQSAARLYPAGAILMAIYASPTLGRQVCFHGRLRAIKRRWASLLMRQKPPSGGCFTRCWRNGNVSIRWHVVRGNKTSAVRLSRDGRCEPLHFRWH